MKRALFFVAAYHFRQNVKARFICTPEEGEAGSNEQLVHQRALEALPSPGWNIDKCQYITDVDHDVFVEV
jgi:hypothetical protein